MFEIGNRVVLNPNKFELDTIKFNGAFFITKIYADDCFDLIRINDNSPIHKMRAYNFIKINDLNILKYVNQLESELQNVK